jgi:hypothetical protein
MRDYIGHEVTEGDLVTVMRGGAVAKLALGRVKFIRKMRNKNTGQERSIASVELLVQGRPQSPIVTSSTIVFYSSDYRDTSTGQLKQLFDMEVV